MNRVVYTAISGHKDTIKEIPENLRSKMHCVAFLDEDPMEDLGWHVKPIRDDLGDPNRNAKYYKVLPHKIFPKAEYSLWIDGSITPITHIDDLIDKYLGENDWAVHKHQFRDCAYEEAMVCGSLLKDDPDVIAKQMARYYVQEGFPMGFGLCENTILLRRHTDEVKEACEMWWEEIENGSRRDQTNFDYVRWKLGLGVTLMEDSPYTSKDFRWKDHVW